MTLLDQGQSPQGVMRVRRSLPVDLDRSGLVMPRLPIPTCSLAFLSRLSDFLGVTISDHPSKDRCQGCSLATVVLDKITSQGRPFSRRHLRVDVRFLHRCHASGDDQEAAGCDAVGVVLAARRLAMTDKAVEHRTNTSERLAVQ